VGRCRIGPTAASWGPPALLYVHVVAVQVHEHVGVLHLALYQVHRLRCRVEHIRLVPAVATPVHNDTFTSSSAVLSAFNQFHCLRCRIERIRLIPTAAQCHSSLMLHGCSVEQVRLVTAEAYAVQIVSCVKD
jgi:hypothetical protein